MFRARWGGGPGQAGPAPRDRVSLGVSGLRTAWGAKSLSWLKRPHPAPRRKTWIETLLLSKVWAELCEKGLVRCDLGPTELEPPLPVKGSAACAPWCPQKAFTCGEPGPR